MKHWAIILTVMSVGINSCVKEESESKSIIETFKRMSVNRSCDSLKTILNSTFSENGYLHAKGLKYLGFCLENSLPDSAAKCYRKSFQILKKAGDKEAHFALLDLAVLMGNQKQLDSAAHYYHEFSTYLDDKSKPLHWFVYYLNMGVIQHQIHDYHGAKEDALLCLKYASQIQDDNKRLLSCYQAKNNYAGLLMDLDQFELAKRYNQEATKCFQELTKSDRTHPYVILNSGIIYMKENQLDSAYSFLKQSDEIFTLDQDPIRKFKVWNALGDYYFAKGNDSLSQHFYKLTIDNAPKYGHSDPVVSAHHKIASLYKRQQNYEMAYYHLYIKDSVEAQLNIDRKITGFNLLRERLEVEKTKRRLSQKESSNRILTLLALLFSSIIVLLVLLRKGAIERRKLAELKEQVASERASNAEKVAEILQVENDDLVISESLTKVSNKILQDERDHLENKLIERASVISYLEELVSRLNKTLDFLKHQNIDLNEVLGFFEKRDKNLSDKLVDHKNAILKLLGDKYNKDRVIVALEKQVEKIGEELLDLKHKQEKEEAKKREAEKKVLPVELLENFLNKLSENVFTLSKTLKVDPDTLIKLKEENDLDAVRKRFKNWSSEDQKIFLDGEIDSIFQRAYRNEVTTFKKIIQFTQDSQKLKSFEKRGEFMSLLYKSKLCTSTLKRLKDSYVELKEHDLFLCFLVAWGYSITMDFKQLLDGKDATNYLKWRAMRIRESEGGLMILNKPLKAKLHISKSKDSRNVIQNLLKKDFEYILKFRDLVNLRDS